MLDSDETFAGQSTDELTSVYGAAIFVFVICWYLAVIFGGALETCMNAVVICGACDEEMFTREQRFMEPDLIELLDAIIEE